MIVYNNGSKAAAMPSFFMSVSPARHLEGQELPSSDWVNQKNEPIDLMVEFKFGRAEVDKNLGEYMIKYGLASKSKLHIPAGVKVA